MVKLISPLFKALFRLLFEVATEAKAPWFWLALVLWAAPFVCAAYVFWIDGGPLTLSLVAITLAVLPVPVRLWRQQTVKAKRHEGEL